jgi:hypothetical protein
MAELGVIRIADVENLKIVILVDGEGPPSRIHRHPEPRECLPKEASTSLPRPTPSRLAVGIEGPDGETDIVKGDSVVAADRKGTHVTVRNDLGDGTETQAGLIPRERHGR